MYTHLDQKYIQLIIVNVYELTYNTAYINNRCRNNITGTLISVTHPTHQC